MNDFGSALTGVLAQIIYTPIAAKGDYTEEGLLYCGKCRTRRQMSIDLFQNGDFITVPVMCDCEEKAREEKIAKDKAAEEAERINARRAWGLSERKWLDATFAKDDRRDAKASDICQRYVDHFKDMSAENIGLMLYGGVGTGKTYLAASIANALIDKGRRVMMASMPTLISRLGFGDERDEMMYRLETVDLLILDDIGAERGTEYGLEQAYEIINTRYISGKPLIVTTNMTPQIMKAEISAKSRGFDRIVEMCRPVLINGDSRRSDIAQSKRTKMIEILEAEQ